MPHILIVDDDPNSREAMAVLAAADGFTVATARDLREAIVHLGRQRPDLVVTDLKLPDGTGLNILEDLGVRSGIELVVVTGYASVATAVDAFRLGAADYLVKPVDLDRLRGILARVPRTVDLREQIDSLRETLLEYGRFGSMLGRSPAMHRLYEQIVRVAPTEATVFLVGESGTGKELAAQTVHELSLRRRQPFLPVNCGAISPTLIESEMFGHERGSFTGADRQHRGFFERAHGGTLFLDEVTEMPPDLQIKLLRVLETGLLLRLGGSREIPVDVRVIAATNRDPHDAVNQQKLREDLYHRLNVFPITLPPLREREGDVDLLAQAFLDRLNADAGEHKRFAADVLADLRAQTWRGNVRELKNFVQRAFILADTAIITASPMQSSFGVREDDRRTLSIDIGTSLAEADKRLILATLDRVGGVRKRAAEVLGISSKTLYNRLVSYGLQEGTDLQPDAIEGDTVDAA